MRVRTSHGTQLLDAFHVPDPLDLDLSLCHLGFHLQAHHTFQGMSKKVEKGVEIKKRLPNQSEVITTTSCVVKKHEKGVKKSILGFFWNHNILYLAK